MPIESFASLNCSAFRSAEMYILRKASSMVMFPVAMPSMRGSLTINGMKSPMFIFFNSTMISSHVPTSECLLTMDISWSPLLNKIFLASMYDWLSVSSPPSSIFQVFSFSTMLDGSKFIFIPSSRFVICAESFASLMVCVAAVLIFS